MPAQVKGILYWSVLPHHNSAPVAMAEINHSHGDTLGTKSNCHWSDDKTGLHLIRNQRFLYFWEPLKHLGDIQIAGLRFAGDVVGNWASMMASDWYVCHA